MLEGVFTGMERVTEAPVQEIWLQLRKKNEVEDDGWVSRVAYFSRLLSVCWGRPTDPFWMRDSSFCRLPAIFAPILLDGPGSPGLGFRSRFERDSLILGQKTSTLPVASASQLDPFENFDLRASWSHPGLIGGRCTTLRGLFVRDISETGKASYPRASL